MSVLLTIPTISFPSKTGALRMPTLWKRRAQYFSARPGETITKGFVMISKTLTAFGSLPGSTISLTMSFRVTIPQASSLVLRLTTRLETFLFRIIAMALVTVSFPSMNTTFLLMTSPTSLNLTFLRLLLAILPPLFLRTGILPVSRIRVPTIIVHEGCRRRITRIRLRQAQSATCAGRARVISSTESSRFAQHSCGGAARPAQAGIADLVPPGWPGGLHPPAQGAVDLEPGEGQA